MGDRRTGTTDWSDAAAIRDLLRAGIPATLAARGRSMEPAARDGARVDLVPCGPEAARVGDVVLVERSRSPVELLLHRVVARRGRLVATRGDAAAGDDILWVGASRLLGCAPALREPAWRTRWRGIAHAGRRWFAATLEGVPDDGGAPRAAWCAALVRWSRGLLHAGDAVPPVDAALWRWLELERLAPAAACCLVATGRGAAPPGDSVPAGDDTLREARARHLRSETARVIADGVLSAAGVAATPMRGAVFAALWPEPAARTSSDLDLVVASDDVSRAIAALTRDHWTLVGYERQAFDDDALRDEFVASANHTHLVARAGSALPPIEPHWRPVPREGAMLLFPDLPASPAALGLHDAARGLVDPAHVPPATVLFLGMLHWAKHHFAPLRELFDASLFLAGERCAALDWPAFVADARRLGLARLAFGYLWAAHRLFAAPVPPAVFGRLAARPARWMLRRRFGPATMLRAAPRGGGMPARLADLALVARWSPRALGDLLRWYWSPGWPYLMETYALIPDRRDDRTRLGGFLRRRHRRLAQRAIARFAENSIHHQDTTTPTTAQ